MNTLAKQPPLSATLVWILIALPAKERAAYVRVIAGGIIPDADIPMLRAMGVHAVFTPGADIKPIVDAVRRAGTEVERA